MVENVFYHEDLVVNVDHVSRILHCGHVEGEAFLDANISTDIITTESLDDANSSDTPMVAPKQFGDKSSDHDDTIDNMFIDDDNQFDNGYFDGPFRGNIYVRWNSAYSRNTDDLNLTLPFDDNVPGENLIKLDRYHQLSDVVKHSVTSKVGIINKVRKKAYAEIIGVNKLLADIDCLKLKSIEKFYPGTSEQLVIYNSWLGRVTSMLREVILKFPDGARVRTSDETIENFEPLFNVNLPEIIFKGSALKGDARDLKNKTTKFIFDSRHYNAGWLKQLKQKQVVEVIVIKVIISSAKVDWLMYKPNDKSTQSDVDIPPTIIKGVNVQNLKSVNTNPFQYCYTGDIWYYQLKQSDKVYNLNDEYPSAKMMYRIVMKENISSLKYTIKANKVAKSNETKAVIDKQIEKESVKKGSVKGAPKSNMKTKAQTASAEKKQVNQNYGSLGKDDVHQNTIRRIQSIYPHLQFRCRRNQLLYRQSNLPFDRKSGKSSKFHKKEVKFQNHSNRENALSPPLTEEHKISPNNDQRPKVTLTKPSKKIINQIQKVTPDMINNFLGNLTVGTWVPIQIILIESLLDVVWQDGTTAHRIPSILFLPEMFDVDEYDFFPGDFVSIKKPLQDKKVADDNSLDTSYGCIVKSKNQERIVTVQWFQSNEDRFCSKVGKYEQSGSYDIKHHKKHHYHIGDIVAISPTCDKTTFPAGYVNSVQPSKGRLSIKWHNSAETFLFPLDLNGIVWDMVSDDFFTSSEDSLDVSTLNLHQDTDDNRYQMTLMNTNKDLSVSSTTVPLVKQLLEKIEKIKETFVTSAHTVKPAMPYDNFMINDIKKDLNDLRNSCMDKSIKLIYETFISNILETNNDTRQNKFEVVGNQLLPSTSNFSDLSSANVSVEINPTIGRPLRIKNDAIIANESTDQMRLSNDAMMNKIHNLNKSLINWLKINVLTEMSTDPTKKTLGSKTAYDVSLESRLNSEVTNIVKTCEAKVETLEDKFSKDFNRSLSLYDDDGESHTKPELNDPMAYDPLPTEELGFFEITDNNPDNHQYVKQIQNTSKNKNFNKAWTRDFNLLTTSLPKGIWVRNYEQRMDLFSIMIEGPVGTPYQNTLFFFDIYLPTNYPDQPPLVHYVSLTNDRINPNLYPDGRVCLSLLGTWIGRGTENWDPKNSNLLQIIISIQGLILVVDPYYNEAGFDSRRGSVESLNNSRRFNESLITSMIIATIYLIDSPVKIFETHIRNYYKENGTRYIRLLKFWATLDEVTYNSYRQRHKTSITIESTSAVTKGVCENSGKTSRNSDMVTNVPSMWSEADTIKIDNSTNHLKCEDILEHVNKIEQKKTNKSQKLKLPEFTLAPVSKGFSLTVNKYLVLLEKSMYKNYMM